MSKSKSKVFNRHMATIAGGVVGEGFIRGMRMALHAADRRERGYSVSSVAPKITAGEAFRLKAAIADNPPRIDPKQEEKGLKWLRSPRVQRELGNRERAVVEDFSHFTLTDFWDAGTSGAAFMIPVYTVHAKNGQTFAYYAGSWQSGVPLSVIA